jgi:penicillin-binding protein 1A
LKKYLKIIIWVVVVAAVLFSAIGGGLWYFWSSSLPYIGNLKDYNPPIITEFYSSDGEVVGRFWKEKRIVLPFDQIPRNLINAFVAAEDDQFFVHKGVDYFGIIRAIVKNQLAGRKKQGASTITQQVARLMLLKSQEKKYKRKVREIILSLQIEKHFSKEEILYLYLNEIYLGSGAYGVESAARTYFNKSVSELNIAECAMLGGLYQAPSRYSPINNFEKAKIRQKYTLDRMLAEGFITNAQWKEALETEIIVNENREEENTFEKSPYFSEYVRRYIKNQYGEDLLYNGGLKVYTTVNLDMQQKAVAAIQKGIRELDKREGYRGPLGSLQPEEYDDVKNETDEGFKENPPVKDMIIKGIVDEVDDEAGQAVVLVGSLKCLLPLKDMEWARKPDTEVAHYETGAEIKKISDALKPGDIILCRLDKPVEDGADSKEAADTKDNKDTKDVEEDEESFDWIISLEQQPVVQGALFSMENKTGKVRAMVGGYDFKLSQYDRANQARRQPGSSFKPIIYAAALDNGITPADIILDTPYVSSLNPDEEPWRPKNNKQTFYGPTLVRKALISSLNVITVKILKKIGVRTVIDYARKMGIESELNADLSLALGTTGLSLSEITKTYSAFANNGLLAEPYYIERVEDRDGLILEENHPSLKEVIPEDTAYIMTDILKGVVQEGTGWRVRALGRPAAGKTGTTDSLWDAWFIGYTPELVTGVWTGYDNMAPMGKNETGSRAASPIWLYFMSEALKGKPVQDFIAPESVVFVKIDKKTGLLASPYSRETVFQSFKKGTEPTEYASKPEAPKSGNFSEFDMDFTENEN